MKVKVSWHFFSFALFQKVQRLCFFSCSITSSFLRLYPQTNTKPKITFAIDVEVRVHRVHWTERQLTSLNRRRQSRSPCERLDMHYFYVRVHVWYWRTVSRSRKSILWPVNIWGDQNTCLLVKILAVNFYVTSMLVLFLSSSFVFFVLEIHLKKIVAMFYVRGSKDSSNLRQTQLCFWTFYCSKKAHRDTCPTWPFIVLLGRNIK